MAGKEKKGAGMMKKELKKKWIRFERKIIDFMLFSNITKNIFSSKFFRLLIGKIEEFREKELLKEIKRHPLPKHVAIIMDGNRRFAKEMKMEICEGHERGADRLEEILEICRELDIKVLTVYAFSVENFRRAREEVTELMDLFFKKFDELLRDERIHRYGIKVRIIGNLDFLPEKVKKKAEEVMKATDGYSNYIFNIAVAYGGRDEITEATKKIMEKVKVGKLKPEEIDESIVSSHLYTHGLPDPDILIRTSGEERLSNFLLWQSANSLLCFYDVYWPSFRKRDFLKIIKIYQRRRNESQRLE